MNGEEYRIEGYNRSLVKCINMELKKLKSAIRFTVDELVDVFEKGDKNIRVVIRKDKETNFYFAVIFNYDMQGITLISYYCAIRDISVSLDVFEYLDIAIYTSKFDTANKVRELIIP